MGLIRVGVKEIVVRGRGWGGGGGGAWGLSNPSGTHLHVLNADPLMHCTPGPWKKQMHNYYILCM